MALSKDLSRDRVLNAAVSILRDHGLASLSMRRVATTLGVQPGALYWHVPSKQDLLGLLAEQILAGPFTDSDNWSTADRIRHQTLEIRTALLAVRDGAEVVLFAQALHPQASVPVQLLRETLTVALPDIQAEWGARTFTHYLLGEVAEEQNHAELTRAGILSEDSGRHSTEAFLFGIDAIFRGLTMSITLDSGHRRPRSMTERRSRQ